MRNGEFVIKLERNRKVFADDFAPYVNEFRKSSAPLPQTFESPPFDDALVYYDVRGMGGMNEGFLLSFLQASRSHRRLADIAFSNSPEIASASRQLDRIPILNESDIVRREWLGDREALTTGVPDEVRRPAPIDESDLITKSQRTEAGDMPNPDMNQISSELRRLDSVLIDVKLNERRFASKRFLGLLIIVQLVTLIMLIVLLRKDFALLLAKLIA
jgi:hypothetical protein